MRLIFNDMGTAISIKSSYSKFLRSSALILLTALLSAAFLMDKENSEEYQAHTANLSLLEN